MIRATLVSIDGLPLAVTPIAGHPDVAVIRIGSEVDVHVTAAEVDRWTGAFNQARELLSAAHAESKENR